MDQEHNARQRAVMYLRVAYGKDEASNAVIAQRAACDHIAKRYNAIIVREYIDHGKPARLEQQSELRRLLADLEQHQDATFVVVSDYARLGRDLQSLDDVTRRIRACGAEIATVTGVETAERFTTAEMLDQVAEWARKPVDVGADGAREPEQPEQPTYSLTLLRAARRGLGPGEALSVVISLPSGETVRGSVNGIGSRLGITTSDGNLLEDVKAEWVVDATIRRAEQQQ